MSIFFRFVHIAYVVVAIFVIIIAIMMNNQELDR